VLNTKDIMEMKNVLVNKDLFIELVLERQRINGASEGERLSTSYTHRISCTQLVDYTKFFLPMQDNSYL